MLFGVEIETVEVLAPTSQLVFADGKRQVCGAMPKLSDSADLISAALQSVCRFVKWSLGRFLTVSTSSMNLIASLSVGL